MKKLLVIFMVLALTGPAAAEMIKVYGSIRTHIGYYDADENFSGGPGMDDTINGAPGTAPDEYDDQGTLLNMGMTSRVGFVAKGSEQMTGQVELGFKTTDDSVYVRIAKGTWDFGAGKLTVGQDYTPATFVYYASATGDHMGGGDELFLLNGMPYVGRKPQIKV